jgi:predicted RNA-binding protein with PUA-like domain
MNYWLIKSEPVKYPWQQLVEDKETFWDGVRNYAARNNLKAMKKGDMLLYYHSNEGLEIVGVAKVSKEHFPDPTIDDETWVAINVKPVKALKKFITLSQIKADPILKEMALVKLSRLSVSPVKVEEFDRILILSETKV